MSKELGNLDITNAIIETPAAEVSTIDELSLTLVGGGEYTVAY